MASKQKNDSVVLFLQQAQTEIQNALKDRCDMSYHDNGHAFGVWIHIRCGKCGYEYRTPFWLKNDGNDRCKECKKKLYYPPKRRKRIVRRGILGDIFR